MYFNNQSRIKNAKLISLSFVINRVVNALIAFIYRVIFLYFLSKEYLGISGLFTNITTIFSLADLGISSVIIYYLYKPINREDKNSVAELMNFYKKFYNFIAMLLFMVGMSITPFLRFFIKDMSEVPKDINIYYVYILYVIQCVVSYLFIYKQSLIEADQRGYLNAIVNTIKNIVSYCLMLTMLIVTRKYILTLIMDIMTNIIFNIIYDRYIYIKYNEVFSIKANLQKKYVKQIMNDSNAMLCHKFGNIVLYATDNIVLSRYVGIIAVGIYSNYLMVTTTLISLVNALLGNWTSTIGNYNINSNKNEKYKLYNKLQFVNMWINFFCVGCFSILINPFIYSIWKDKSLILNKNIIILISISCGISLSNIINLSYIYSNGLFVKDKIRPIIEAALNLIISIILAKKIGIAGVILGTIISSLLTSWWRVPYLVYKFIFESSCIEYFKKYFTWVVITLVGYIVLENICNLFSDSILYFIIKIIICIVGFNVIFLICFGRTDEFKYIWRRLMKKNA